MMQFVKTVLSDVILVIPKKFGDARGYFSEKFRLNLFRSEVGDFDFVQDNSSFSAEAGTVRGLHFQAMPNAQGKLVTCTAGAIMDVAVDIRKGSPTYGRTVTAELTEENCHQLWVPPGFAHGFCTLKSKTVVSYKVTDYYSPELDRGLLWNDPVLNIDWPVPDSAAILSDKDKTQPMLHEIETNFIYQP